MAEERKGFVKKIFKKEGTSSKGPWYAFSFKIEDENGNEDPMFYQLGFNTDCPFKENDYIKFSADPKDDKAMTLVKGSGQIVKNPPQRAAKPENSGGGRGRGGRGGPQVKTSELFGEIGGYNTEDDIRRMSYSAARGDAVEVVGLLLANDALPMSTAKSKAGVAKRFEEIVAQVDKLTVEFFFDSATGRKLEAVADAGEVNVDADSALPDPVDEEQPDAADDSGDDLPPEDDGETGGTF